MHAKIYLSSRRVAIVGSANLSRAALADIAEPVRDEAAVLVRSGSLIKEIDNWFRRMWKESRVIKETDLKRAEAAWKSLQWNLRKNKSIAQGSRSLKKAGKSTIHIPKKIEKRLLALAMKVHKMNLRTELAKWHGAVSHLGTKPLRKRDVERVIDTLVEWAGHPVIFERIHKVPLMNLKLGFSVLFDESQELLSRLHRLQQGKWLKPLQMPSLSMLLYWRYPERYPPFNDRTKRFLKRFRLSMRGISSSSPECYCRWLRYATQLSQALRLPSAGHVDRVVRLSEP